MSASGRAGRAGIAEELLYRLAPTIMGGRSGAFCSGCGKDPDVPIGPSSSR